MKHNNVHLIIACLVVFVVLSSCDNDDAVKPIGGDYLPLNANTQWTYKQSIDFSTETDDQAWGTVVLNVRGDTVIEGKTYRKLVTPDGAINKIVRSENGKYFGRNHEVYSGFTHEYVFLDTAVPEGGSWTIDKFGGAVRTEYVVESVNGVYEAEGVTYHDVIKLVVNYYDQVSDGSYEFRCSAKHYYARGIGEVYSFYPYPVSGAFGDITAILIDHNP